MAVKKIREDVVVEKEGQIYSGYRIIKGTLKLFQTIYYKEYEEYDSHSYEPHQTDYMKLMAKTILGQLIERENL